MRDRQTHFDALYAASPDPWDFETSAYEREKYCMTLQSLPCQRYRSTLEVGCSIGVLGRSLAERSVAYLGVDLSPGAVAQARLRMQGVKGAEVRIAEVPREWPVGCYDLIVLSEILYYLSAPELDDLAGLVAHDALSQADCVLVNWCGETGMDLTGPGAAAHFLHALRGQRSVVELATHLTPRYQLQILRLE